MNDLTKYDTPARAAEAAGVNRRTFEAACARRDDGLEIEENASGDAWVSLRSAKKWAKNRPKPGPKPKAKSKR